MKSIISTILLIAIIINVLSFSAFAKNDDLEPVLIDIVVSKEGNGYIKTVDALVNENDIYIKAEQFSDLTRYSYQVTEDNRGIFKLGMKTVVIDYKRQTLKVNNIKQSFSGAISLDGNYFLPFSEIAPWLNVSIDIEKGCLRLESDILSYWEVIDEFDPMDFYFFYVEELGDDPWAVAGLTAMHVLDSLLNLDDVWKKTVTVTGDKDDTSLYDYEVYVDTFRDFGIPEDTTSETLGIVNSIGKSFSNFTTLSVDLVEGLTSKECYEEIAYALGKKLTKDISDTMSDPKLYREMLIKEGSEVLGDYESWKGDPGDFPKTMKQINSAFKMLNAGFACLNIMMADTESYADALEYIYLRKGAKTTGGEKLAAQKVCAMMNSNIVAILESAKPLVGKFTADACDKLVKDTIDIWAEAAGTSIHISSIGTYLDVMDAAFSVFWPVNKAASEISKLSAYTAIQQNAFDAYLDSKITNSEIDAKALEISRMTAIIYLKATRKCFEAKDKYMSVYGGAGLLDGYYKNVNEMIGNFEICLLAQENDEINSKKDYTKEIRQYLEDLNLLKTNDSSGSNIILPPFSSGSMSERLIGEWYYIETVVENGWERYKAWDITFKENGEIIVGVGYIQTDNCAWYEGTWSLAYKSGQYILTIKIEKNKCECVVTIDGNKLKLDKKSGDDKMGIKCSQWYEYGKWEDTGPWYT